MDLETSDIKAVLCAFIAGLNQPGNRSDLIKKAVIIAHGTYSRMNDPSEVPTPDIPSCLKNFVYKLANQLQTKLTLVIDGVVHVYCQRGYQYCPTPVIACYKGAFYLGGYNDGRCIDAELDSRLIEWGNLLRVGSGVITGRLEVDAIPSSHWEYRWPRAHKITEANVEKWLASMIIVPTTKSEGHCLEEALAWFNHEDSEVEKINRSFASSSTTGSLEKFANHHKCIVTTVTEDGPGRYLIASYTPHKHNGTRASFLLAAGHIQPLRSAVTSSMLQDIMTKGATMLKKPIIEWSQTTISPSFLLSDFELPVDANIQMREWDWTLIWHRFSTAFDPTNWSKDYEIHTLFKLLGGKYHDTTVDYEAKPGKIQKFANYHAAMILWIRPDNSCQMFTPLLGSKTHARASIG